MFEDKSLGQTKNEASNPKSGRQLRKCKSINTDTGSDQYTQIVPLNNLNNHNIISTYGQSDHMERFQTPNDMSATQSVVNSSHDLIMGSVNREGLSLYAGGNHSHNVSTRKPQLKQ